MRRHFARGHGIVFLVLLVVFTPLYAWIAHSGLDEGPHHLAHVIKVTVFSVTGPWVGAISRDFQSCCTEAALTLTVYGGLALLAGVVVQFMRFPRSPGWRFLRLGAWTAGWFAWFVGGVLSLAHAIS